ncbi:MAG TPA: hypothetical protein VE174_05195 [Actinomycetota bacterium]|nr:hypothetical protein [Actinomycetota bacterium]
MGSGFDRLFDELDAGFEAAIAREEEDAANDLARALRQDGNLRTAIERGSWRLKLDDGLIAVVTEVGTDYVVASDTRFGWLVPLSRAFLYSDPDSSFPRSFNRSLIESLRAHARAGARVEILSDLGPVTGRLIGAAVDHVRLVTSKRDVLIAARTIRGVRFEVG